MGRRFVWAPMLGVPVVTLAAALGLGIVQRPDSGDEPALLGRVTSQEEGPMEGVLVSAKRAGSTVTTTVVSTADGRYSFPADRLARGEYAISIRAVGYDLDAPAPVHVTVGRGTPHDLQLRKAQDLSSQLSNGEWLLSMSGTDEQKLSLLRGNCVYCHTLERTVRTRYNARQLEEVLRRMSGYAQGSTPLRPQRQPGFREPSPAQQQQMAKDARYVSSINLSGRSTWDYALKTLPRPTGKSTRVLVTTYDLPRPETLPHDVGVDSEGMVWYADFGSQYLGMLDPATGAVVEYAIPVTKPGAPTGALDLRFDHEGNIWMATMYQGAVAKFDRKTRKFQTWTAPGHLERDETRIAMIGMPLAPQVDGTLWVGGDTEYQFNPRSSEWKRIEGASFYGVAANSQNNGYGMELNRDNIIEVDAKTLKSTLHRTPTPDSGPRRGHMDAQDRLWFAEFRANKIGMFDTKAKQFKEWAIPSPWMNPYDALLDKGGFVWTGGMTNDRVGRLNTKTEEITEYLLPRISTNIRRVAVDDTTTPSSFWVGDNLGASIIRVEPRQ